MALTSVTRVTRTIFGNKRVTVHDVVGPSSYTTGGEALTAKDLGLRKIESVTCDPTESGYIPRLDLAAGKIQYFEVDEDHTDDGPLVEVGSTTDLDAETTRITAWGI